MNCSTYFSIDSQFTHQRRAIPILNIFHNIALRAITLQLCLLYLSSSLAKITGPLWQKGTAIYYVLKSSAFSNPLWSSVLSSNYFLITLSSYLVVALQGSFIFLIWSKWFRLPVIFSLMLMHVFIGYQMGLVRFSNATIAGLLLLIPDKIYFGIYSLVGRIVGSK